MNTVVDTLAAKAVYEAESAASFDFNYWILVALAELAIIIILSGRLRAVSRRTSQKKAILSKEIDLDNVIDSSFKSKELYEQLVRQYHPDRYVGDDAKMAMAQEIAAQIGQNRYDSKKLRELAEVAKRKLE